MLCGWLLDVAATLRKVFDVSTRHSSAGRDRHHGVCVSTRHSSAELDGRRDEAATANCGSGLHAVVRRHAQRAHSCPGRARIFQG